MTKGGFCGVVFHIGVFCRVGGRKRGLGNVGTGEIRIEVHEKREMDGVERIGRLRDVEGLMMDIFAFLCFSNVDPNFNMSVFFFCC